MKTDQYTAEQIQHYKQFEKVRQGGRFSMIDPEAMAASELDRDEFIFVMKNYSNLRAAAAIGEAK